MVEIPQMETPNEMSIDNVGLMALMDDKEDIIEVPQGTPIDGIEGSTALYETLGPNMI
jgi:hypothetical protein